MSIFRHNPSEIHVEKVSDEERKKPGPRYEHEPTEWIEALCEKPKGNMSVPAWRAFVAIVRPELLPPEEER